MRRHSYSFHAAKALTCTQCAPPKFMLPRLRNTSLDDRLLRGRTKDRAQHALPWVPRAHAAHRYKKCGPAWIRHAPNASRKFMIDIACRHPDFDGLCGKRFIDSAFFAIHTMGRFTGPNLTSIKLSSTLSRFRLLPGKRDSCELVCRHSSRITKASSLMRALFVFVS